MIGNSTADNIVQRFPNHQRVAVDEGDECIGTPLNVTNQFGIEYKLILIEPGQTNHMCRCGEKPPDSLIGNFFGKFLTFSVKKGL